MDVQDPADIGRALDEMAALLGLEGEPKFKVRAYERAARIARLLGPDLGALVEQGRLRSGGQRRGKATAAVQRAGALRRGRGTVSALELVGGPGARPALEQVAGMRQMLRVDRATGVAQTSEGLRVQLHGGQASFG